MQLYKTLYHLMFNAATDAVRALEEDDAEAARRILVQAQQRAEARYLEETESNYEK